MSAPDKYVPKPLVGMHKQPMAQKLLSVTDAYDDRQVAMMLADRCIELTDRPYRFAINHDIRPPKNLACPLRYDWARKGYVGIETRNALEIRQWLTKAFRLGYTVQQATDQRERVGFPHSLEIVRRRAKNHQAPKDDTDDIPF